MTEQRHTQISNLQRSYLVGRTMKNNLGGVACHAYFEFEGKNLNVEAFQKAWEAVVAGHFMTSAKIKDDGTACSSDTGFLKSLFIFDLSKEEEAAAAATMEDCRKNSSHRKMEVARGQGIGGILFLLPGKKHRLCFDIDLAVCDVNGIQSLLNELGTRYAKKDYSRGEILPIPQRNEIARQEIAVNPIIPDYGNNVGELSGCSYGSFDYKLTEEESLRMKEYFEGTGGDLFSGMLFLLAKSSSFQELSVNIPYYSVASGWDPVSDNTKIFWLNLDKKDLHLGRLQTAIRQKLAEEEKKYHNSSGIVPVVYSYNQNGIFLNGDFRNNIGNLTFMISQTPNVCLDVQLFNMVDGILISFVYPKEMEGVEKIKEWFNQYTGEIKECVANGK